MPVLEMMKRVLRPSLSTREAPSIAENRLKIWKARDPKIITSILVMSVVYTSKFAYLKAAVDSTLCVWVFHSNFFKEQANVVRHETVSATQSKLN